MHSSTACRGSSREISICLSKASICVGQPFKPSIDSIEQSNWRSFGHAPIKGAIQSGKQDKWKKADYDANAFEYGRRLGTDR
jgi:hypothetical protein